MIESIHIKNYKSVVDLSLELGTFNVLIGENGCGKSNILEAIAFGAAASADKLDFEFLGSRGIRVTSPEFMFSAFSNGEKEKAIYFEYKIEDKKQSFELINAPQNPKKWINKTKDEIRKHVDALFSLNEQQRKLIESIAKTEKKITSEKGDIDIDNEREKLEVFKTNLEKLNNELENWWTKPEISNYIIYSPEQNSLRKFEETNQIYPLGIKGEGLFQYLKELALDKKQKKIIDEIKQSLVLLDWYEDFELPDNLISNEFSLRIKDKYLYESLQYFDQRSTNEGFLFLLFYSTLFISKATPSFFAIDNIDTSLNPKLCVQLIKNLSALAKKYKKQVIVTTHNPAVLDGLNLKDNNQRLFVVRRNDEGHTKAKRVEYNASRKMKLSELWTSGFIGGLPENF